MVGSVENGRLTPEMRRSADWIQRGVTALARCNSHALKCTVHWFLVYSELHVYDNDFDRIFALAPNERETKRKSTPLVILSLPSLP